MSAPADKAELLERERRLMKPAGYAAIAGVVLFVASSVIQSGVGGGQIETDAERLVQFGEDGGTLLLSRIAFGLAFLCFTLPIYTLFCAIRARTDRVRGSFVAFCFIGPVLLAIQGPLLAVGYTDAGEKFLEQAPAVEAEQAPEPAKGSQGETTATSPTQQETTTSPDEDAADDENTPTEQLAEDLIEDSGTISFAQPLLLPAVLGMITLMIFINLWALRTGLLTRFWGSLGIALGAALFIVFPVALLGTALWILALGMLLLGVGRKPRPPAWEAGVAMPWTKPPEEPDQGEPGAVEGSGRDISDEGPDAPGGPNGAGGPNGSGGGPELPPGPTQPPPRKRKRRG